MTVPRWRENLVALQAVAPAAACLPVLSSCICHGAEVTTQRTMYYGIYCTEGAIRLLLLSKGRSIASGLAGDFLTALASESFGFRSDLAVFGTKCKCTALALFPVFSSVY